MLHFTARALEVVRETPNQKACGAVGAPWKLRLLERGWWSRPSGWLLLCLALMLAGCSGDKDSTGDEDPCEPDCSGRMCGDDGCGGECPPGCGEGFGCTPQGHCASTRPSITALSAMPQSTSPLGTITLRVVASSSLDAELSYAWKIAEELDGTGWSIADSDEAETTLSAPEQYGSTALVKVTVTAGNGSSPAVGHLVVSTVENRGPVLTAVTANPLVAPRGGSVTLAAEAHHPDGLDLNYHWELPKGWSMDQEDPESATIITTAPQVAGASGIARVRVEDDFGLSVSGAITVSTRPPSHPLIMDLTAEPMPAARGETVTIEVSAVDPETGESEGLTYTFETTGGFILPEATESLTTTESRIEVLAPSEPGAQGRVLVTVDNGHLTSGTSAPLATRENRPPIILSVPATTIISSGWDGPWTYQVVAEDPDGDEITYALLPEDGPAAISETGLVTWHPTCDDEGELELVVVVTDEHGASARQHLNMLVDFSLIEHKEIVSAFSRRLPAFGERAESAMHRAPGACLLEDMCEEVTRQECEKRDGDWNFEGPHTRCALEDEPYLRRGACCFSVFTTCDHSLSPQECMDQGGEFMGFGTSCDEHVICAGACCTPDGCSMEAYWWLCEGDFAGPGTSCDEDLVCHGACCSLGGDGGCRLEALDECSADDDYFRGVGTLCTDDGICEIGACCAWSGCRVTSRDECEDPDAGVDSGVYAGDYVPCETDDDPVCVGSCVVNGTCEIVEHPSLCEGEFTYFGVCD